MGSRSTRAQSKATPSVIYICATSSMCRSSGGDMVEVRHICPHCGHGVGRLMRVKNEGVSNCANCHKSDWSRRFPFPGADPARAQQEAQEARRIQLDAIFSRMPSRKEEPADVESPERNAPTAAQHLAPEEEGLVRIAREEASDESCRTFFTPSGAQLPRAPDYRLRTWCLITAVVVVVASAADIALGRSVTQPPAETAPRPAPTITVTMTATATATETVTASPADQAKAQPVEPIAESEPAEEPTPQNTLSDSPGRHDGSNYDNLSPEGQEAHDTLNCADVPGHKKGSCNEPNRKCNLDGAQVTSSGGIRLTCQMADDERLRWLP